MLLNPYWIALRRDKTLVAALVLLYRQAGNGHGGKLNSYFIRYLAISNRGDIAKRREPAGERQSLVEQFAKSPVRGCMMEIFARPGQLFNKCPLPGKAVFYACVELENERSLQICQRFGFVPLRSLATVAFSRFFPKRQAGCERLNKGEEPAMLALLNKQYAQYSFFCPKQAFYGGTYFVLKREGQVVAGLLAIADHWRIEHLPGLSGRLILHVLPRLPLLARLFNPGSFKLALLSGIYVKEGHEKDLVALMEHVLWELKLNTAFIWADDKSDLLHQLLKAGGLGLLNVLKGDVRTNLVARFEGFTAEEIEVVGNRPAYMGAFDFA